MTLHTPFEIGPRLAPALRIQDSETTAWISYQDGQFVIDLPDGTEHKVTDFRPGHGANLVRQFGDILSFLGACAESRKYARGRGKSEMDGENSDLFPANVGEWAERMSDEIAMLQCEIEESETELIES
jgi:hypothetical protein